jgi:transcriptional regulator with XRE-family HTH domain
MQGKELKEKRLGLNLTQAELGERLGVTGWTVANWERSETISNGKLLAYALAGLEMEIGLSNPALAAARARVRHARTDSARRCRELNQLEQKTAPRRKNLLAA